MKINIKGEELVLDKKRALYLSRQHLLAISDLHLGKAAHFRKAGLAVPNAVSQHDLKRLTSLLLTHQPKTLLINGDMFHSDYNTEIDEFARWRKNFGQLEILLVKGNHDKQKEEIYQHLDIKVFESTYALGNLCFIHNASDYIGKQYPIAGHIHPGISIYNEAKQRLKFPCFYFAEQYALLPAFSEFTGLQMIRPKQNEQVFAITPNKVIKV